MKCAKKMQKITRTWNNSSSLLVVLQFWYERQTKWELRRRKRGGRLSDQKYKRLFLSMFFSVTMIDRYYLKLTEKLNFDELINTPRGYAQRHQNFEICFRILPIALASCYLHISLTGQKIFWDFWCNLYWKLYF